MSHLLKYISSYPADLQLQVQKMIDQKSLGSFLLGKYASTHDISNDRDLREYVMALKNSHLKKSDPLGKIVYDNKIHIINNALGLHSSVYRVQGSKLKSKNEIRISAIFKKSPEAFLNMIVVHELAHLKEREHNKAFYKLCQHMLPDYHQLEFDMRLYLIQLELNGPLYQ